MNAEPHLFGAWDKCQPLFFAFNYESFSSYINSAFAFDISFFAKYIFCIFCI